MYQNRVRAQFRHPDDMISVELGSSGVLQVSLDERCLSGPCLAANSSVLVSCLAFTEVPCLLSENNF